MTKSQTIGGGIACFPPRVYLGKYIKRVAGIEIDN